MYKRRDIDTSSLVPQTIVESGVPVVILGSVSCSLNGIHAYYQDLVSIEVERPRFAKAELVIKFRGGTVLRFQGPHPLSFAQKKFVSDVNRLRGNIIQLARENWRTLLANHFSRQRPFSVDEFRYVQTGDIYKNEDLITSIYDPSFTCEDRSGKLVISADPKSEAIDEVEFDVGPFPEILAAFLNDLHNSGPTHTDDEWSGIEETASKAVITLAALVGAWRQEGLEEKLRKFASLRQIDYNRVVVDLDGVDYVKLAFDKRLVRNLYQAIADYCALPVRARRFRFDDLVGDLARVAADGNRLSDISLHLLYEVALFQGYTMGYVPKIIASAIGLEGQPWVEVKKLNEGQFDEFRHHDTASGAENRSKNGTNNEGFRDHRTNEANERARTSNDRFSSQSEMALSIMTRQYLLFFGFEAVPSEKDFKQSYRNMLKKHHPDNVALNGNAEEIRLAKEMTQQINARKEWLAKDLSEYWETIAHK